MQTANLAAALAFVALLYVTGVYLIFSSERRRRKAVLRERERLALDIHDTLAQSFAGIAFQLQALRAEISKNETLSKQLDVALDMVRRSHSEAKQKFISFHPGSADEGDLAESLRQFAESLRSGGPLLIQSSSVGRTRKIPLVVRDAMLFVGREAITNSMRHSGASRLEITLTVENRTAQLIVRDNGCGFVADAGYYGFGLRNMLRRAAGISAQLEIASAPGTGTFVSISRRIRKWSVLRWRIKRQLRPSTLSGL